MGGCQCPASGGCLTVTSSDGYRAPLLVATYTESCARPSRTPPDPAARRRQQARLITVGWLQFQHPSITTEVNGASVSARNLIAAAATISTTILTAAGDHSCTVVSGGVQCWGDDIFGELGNNSTSTFDYPTPVPVIVGLIRSGLAIGVQAIATGEEDTCALVNGSVQCRGNDDFGELGSGASTLTCNNIYLCSAVPVPFSGLVGPVDAIAVGTASRAHSQTVAFSAGAAMGTAT